MENKDRATLNFNRPDIRKHESTCQRCGGEMFVYLGEPKHEWDIEKHEWADAIPGQLLPCPNCMTRQAILIEEAKKLQYMIRRSNQPAPEGVNAVAWGRKIEKWTQQAEGARGQFEGVCQSWGFIASQITERMYTLEQRRRDHADE